MMERTFKTRQFYEAIRDIRLTDEEILVASNEIYNRLKTDVFIAQKNRGRDYITHIPERKVGKSYSLMRIAEETGHPIIVRNLDCACLMQRDAKKHGMDINVISIKSKSFLTDCVGYFVMLKDEGVDIVEVRDRLNEKELCRRISVVGIN